MSGPWDQNLEAEFTEFTEFSELLSAVLFLAVCVKIRGKVGIWKRGGAELRIFRSCKELSPESFRDEGRGFRGSIESGTLFH